MISEMKTASNLSVSLETVASTLPIGMLLFDAHENVVYANPAAETLFGNKASVSRYFRRGDYPACRNGHETPDDCGRSSECPDCFLLQAIRSALNGKDENTAGETKIERPSGLSPLWIKYQARSLDVFGSRLAQLFIDDITGYKQTEEALRISEKSYRDLFNDLPVGLYKTTLDGKIIDANPACLSISGCPETEREAWLAQDTRQSYVRPEDAEKLREHLLIEGQINAFEAPFKKWDGSVAWLSNSARLVTDDEGRPVAISGSFVDISDRKKVENEIKMARDFLETAIAQSPSGILIADAPDVTIRIANKAALDIRGSNSGLLTGIDVAKHSEVWQTFRLDGSPYPSEELPLSRAVLNGEVTKDEDLIIRDHAGNKKWVKVNAAPIYDTQGSLTAGIVIFHDITDQKMFEEGKSQQEKRMQQAQKLEAIGSLSGGIAHDFNNLLFPIIGLSQMLLTDLPPGSPEHEKARHIMNAGERCRDLVKQILAFSRQTEHQMVPVRVQQVVKEVLKLCRASIPAEIEITRNLEPDCGPVLADPAQVHQVAMNLIINAYHACEAVDGTIHIDVRQVDMAPEELKGKSLEPGPHVLMTVEDTGCGIGTEALDRIFEPYFTTKDAGKGTGLGLATVYGIVKEHQGDIMVDSEPGRGAVFTVYLPLMEPSADAHAPAVPACPSIGGSERIFDSR